MSSVDFNVIVAHPSTQHSSYLAAALEKANLLQYYVTRLYKKTDHPAWKLQSRFPTKGRATIDRFFVNRYHPDIPPSKVKLYYTWDELYSIVRNQSGTTVQERLDFLRQTRGRFGQRVANLAVRQGAKAIVCYSGAALEAFQIAKENGILCILDQAHPDVRFAHKLFKNEIKLIPHLADSINDFTVYEPDNSPEFQYHAQSMELADYILAGSSFSKNTMINFGVESQKIYTIPYGADPELFFPPQKKESVEKFRLLFVGTVSQLKGIYYLLEAVKRLDLPDLQLTLCGGLAVPDKFLEAYQPYIRYLGRLAPETLAEEYRNSDVFVFPSIYDGFGRVILESMASGLCVITTPNTGGPDVITEGQDGFIVPIRDINSLMTRIYQLYQDRNLCAEMGINAYNKAKFWGWDQYNENITTAFQSFIEK